VLAGLKSRRGIGLRPAGLGPDLHIGIKPRDRIEVSEFRAGEVGVTNQKNAFPDGLHSHVIRQYKFGVEGPVAADDGCCLAGVQGID